MSLGLHRRFSLRRLRPYHLVGLGAFGADTTDESLGENRFKAEATLNGSMPMSMRRVTVSRSEFVWGREDKVTCQRGFVAMPPGGLEFLNMMILGS
jgi:hypothetical protein